MCEFFGGFTPILMNPRESLSLIKRGQTAHPRWSFMDGFVRAYGKHFNRS